VRYTISMDQIFPKPENLKYEEGAEDGAIKVSSEAGELVGQLVKAATGWKFSRPDGKTAIGTSWKTAVAMGVRL
jgi:hypothetical protein